MIESKLLKASLNLPKPSSTFSIIEAKAYANKTAQVAFSHRYRMIAAILACAVLLMVGGVVAATTEVDYSAWAISSTSFSDFTNAVDRIGVGLPADLGGSPYYNITTMYVVPEGTTYFEALINPAYPWYSVNYNEYSISFGSTDNELYKYVFSLDESAQYIFDDALPDSYRTEEYNGVTLQIVTDMQYDKENTSEIFAFHHRVIWVDANNHAVFSLRKSFYAEEDSADQFPNEMISFAKEIIDLNSK